MTVHHLPSRRTATALAVLVTTVLALPGLAACSGGSDDAQPTAAASGAATGAVTAQPAAETSAPAPGGSAGTASGSAQASGGATASGASGGAQPGATPSGTATVGLVAGFPTDLVPIPPKATVTASAVRNAGDRLELSLSATTKAPAKDILVWYDKRFRAQGFTPADGKTIAPGTGGRIYARGDEVILLAVNDAGGLRSFSVGGTVAR